MKHIFLCLFAVLFLSIPATAEDAVQANRSTLVYDFSVWFSADCSHMGKPRYKVRTHPKHGRLSFLFGATQARNLPKRCQGKVKGLQVVYTPNRGYRGPDSFVMTVFQPRFLHDEAPVGRTVRPKFTVK